MFKGKIIYLFRNENSKFSMNLIHKFKYGREKRALIRDICSAEGSERNLDYYECCKISVLKVRLDLLKKMSAHLLHDSPFCSDCMYYDIKQRNTYGKNVAWCWSHKLFLPEAEIECEGQSKESVIKRYDYERKVWIDIPYGSDEHLERAKLVKTYNYGSN